AHALSKIAPGNFVRSLFLQAIGSGMSLHPCRPRPLGASLRLAPPYGNASAIYSRTRASL
ncbi:hypothetical protein AB8780_20580, partial [Enterobacter sp. SAT-E-asb]|uniref:hypothetical protein n=1 Tax=Enterobacter sp. SAT-E-asb TaxID=3241615 RepID=UPI003531FAF0